MKPIVLTLSLAACVGPVLPEAGTSSDLPSAASPRGVTRGTMTRGSGASEAPTQRPVWTVENPDVHIPLGAPRGRWAHNQGVWEGAPERGPLSVVMFDDGSGAVGPMGFPIGGGGGEWAPGCLSEEATCGATLRRRSGPIEEAWTLEDERLWYRALVHEAAPGPLQLKVLSGPRVTAAGTGFVVEGPRGTVRVDGAAAWDADGQAVPARLGGDAGSVWVEVDTTGATMPILIDPWVMPEDQRFPFAPYGYGVFFRGAGDPNGDGYEDLEIYQSTQLIYYGSPAGVGTDWSDRTASAFADGVVWRPFDFTGDGLGDFETGCGGAIGLWKGRAGTTIMYDRPIAWPSGTSSGLHGCTLAGADVDGDGYDDLILPELSTAGYPGFSIFRGGPTYATWTQLQSPPYLVRENAGQYKHAEPGDVNADGYADVLLVLPAHPLSARPGIAELYLGGPAGAALTASWSSQTTAGLEADRVLDGTVVEDVDGDGTADIALSGAYHTAWWVPGGASAVGEPVALGDWSPMCQGSYGYCEEYWEVSLDGVGDLNADGHNDLVLQSGDGAAVILGGPYGPVLPPYTVLDISVEGGLLYANRVGDLNADGYDELAIATPLNYPNQFVYLWYGEGIDDIDQDGVLNSADCEPYRHDTFPGGVEVAGNAWDEDCDGTMLCFSGVDADHDGATGPATVTLAYNRQGCVAAGALATAPDCDDSTPQVGPAMAELSDNDVDEDCDTQVSCHADADGDGYGGADITSFAAAGCGALAPGLWNIDGLDCDDARADIHPGATDIAGVEDDEDCDGIAMCFADVDQDGYGEATLFLPSTDTTCEHAGLSAVGTDCDDNDVGFNPGLFDEVNLIDEDCDQKYTCYRDYDNDGYGDSIGRNGFFGPCDSPQPNDYQNRVTGVTINGDCNGSSSSAYPGAPEDSYGSDDNCDGLRTCTLDEDGDGYAAEFGPATLAVTCTFPPGVSAAGDCDDHEAATHPGAPEPPGGPDRNCNNNYTCFEDEDQDGYGTTLHEYYLTECNITPGVAAVGGDCAPNAPARHPGAAEVVGDALDQDCDDRLACWVDADHDGFGGTTAVNRRAQTCDNTAAGLSARSGDCDDATATTLPGVLDRTGDGVDADCDGLDGLRMTIDDTTRSLTLRAQGAGARARVTFTVSTVGVGAGPCPPALGGACAGLLSPRVVGTVTADAAGVATTVVTVPGAVRAGAHLAWQAWVVGPTPAEGSPPVQMTVP